MIDLKTIPLEQELGFWTAKGAEAIEQRTFVPLVAGYWTPGTAIIKEQESRHFCLAFPAPSSADEMTGLLVHLKLQLLYNNAAAYVYVGAQKIQGAESETSLVVLGDNGEEKVCWVTPFDLGEGTVKFYDTVSTKPETFTPWDVLLPKEEDIAPDMDTTIRELHKHLLGCKELSESGAEVAEFFRQQEKDNIFQGISSEEIFHLCILYIAARTEEQVQEEE